MARDKFHQEVKEALQNEGWHITHDPLYLKIGKMPIHIDMGAQRIFGAEKEGKKIAVEVKTFSMPSFVAGFHEAVGKYVVYREAMLELQENRTLYLAIPEDAYEEYGGEILVQRVFNTYQFKIIVYEPITKIIKSWLD
jgi:XisH protein